MVTQLPSPAHAQAGCQRCAAGAFKTFARPAGRRLHDSGAPWPCCWARWETEPASATSPTIARWAAWPPPCVPVPETAAGRPWRERACQLPDLQQLGQLALVPSQRVAHHHQSRARVWPDWRRSRPRGSNRLHTQSQHVLKRLHIPSQWEQALQNHPSAVAGCR